MNITDDIKPLTYLETQPRDLLQRVNEKRRPVIITQEGEPRAVVLDPRTYENMRNAIGMLKLVSQSELDIRAGELREQAEVFKGIETALKERHL